MGSRAAGFVTQLIHAGESRSRYLGAARLPILQPSVFDERWLPSEILRYTRRSSCPHPAERGTRLTAPQGPR
jgi:hypothetical protein